MMLLMLAMACDDTEFPTPEGGEAVSGDSFSDVLTVFEGDCLSCHSAAAALGGLDLETDPCAALVGAQASGYDAKLVEPGDHAASVLWNKMEDSGAYGGVMPQGGKIAQSSVDTVAAWIDKGASCSDGTGGTGGTDSGGGTATNYTFAEVQERIFDAACVGCHVAGGNYSGLELTAGASYDNIVGVASAQRPGMALIEPGNPELSYLMHKIRGLDHEEAVMPPGGAGLDPELIALAYGWVLSGAER